MPESDCASPYSQAQPFVRDRVDRNGYTSVVPSTVDRENRLLQQKIHAIKHRPSSTCTASLHAAASRSAAGSVAGGQPWESFRVQSHIQPSAGKSLRRQRIEQVQQENLVLQRKLQQRYGIRRDSFVVAHQLGPGLDCNSRWQQRTSLYGCPQEGHGADKRSILLRPSSAPAKQLAGTRQEPNLVTCSTYAARNRDSKNTGVPKTLGVAACAGCGCRSFYQADGARLKPCPHCKQVYYCSESCARVDQPSHKAVCRYYVTGHWTAAGVRPTADCWVMNRAMAVARRLLKQRQHLQNNVQQSCNQKTTAAVQDSRCRGSDLGTSSIALSLQVADGLAPAVASCKELHVATAASTSTDAARHSMTDAVALDLGLQWTIWMLSFALKSCWNISLQQPGCRRCKKRRSRVYWS